MRRKGYFLGTRPTEHREKPHTCSDRGCRRQHEPLGIAGDCGGSQGAHRTAQDPVADFGPRGERSLFLALSPSISHSPTCPGPVLFLCHPQQLPGGQVLDPYSQYLLLYLRAQQRQRQYLRHPVPGQLQPSGKLCLVIYLPRVDQGLVPMGQSQHASQGRYAFRPWQPWLFINLPTLRE